ncbi:hypothetical protein EVAR_14311_1 [Eumeta japonica]|uniref:Uncharacterized protein n=1 Tax=Eumeta variegata TaxID=151549 RepID=A0A4C1UMT6_EUMVA|nr:hypothetical protein EVAR_14311_1 [Eumeta japonica]
MLRLANKLTDTLSTNQHGFLRGRSTATALNSILRVPRDSTANIYAARLSRHLRCVRKRVVADATYVGGLETFHYGVPEGLCPGPHSVERTLGRLTMASILSLS